MTERVVEFGSAGNLTGILNQPTSPAAGAAMPVLLLLNSGTLHRVGPCRLYVRLARQLADQDIASLRFDFSGIGDSSPRTDGKVFHQYSIEEVGDAINYLSSLGYARFYLLGICSGADTAWYSATVNQRVNGIVLLDGFAFRNAGFYWHHYKRRIFDLNVWKNFLRNPLDAATFLAGKTQDSADIEATEEVVFGRDWPEQDSYHEGIAKLIERGTSAFYIFTGGAADYFNHRSQLGDSCQPAKNSALVSIDYYPDADHMISGTEAQIRIIDSIGAWIAEKETKAAP